MVFKKLSSFIGQDHYLQQKSVLQGKRSEIIIIYFACRYMIFMGYAHAELDFF